MAPVKGKDENSREKIIQAAIKEFSISGFHGARVDAIAKRSGINKAMIYYHFKNKDGLYQAIIGQLFDKISGIINEHASLDMPPDEKLFTMIRSLSTFIYELGDDMRHVMVWEVASGGKNIIAIGGKRIRQIVPVVKKMYEDGMKNGTFRKDINPLLTHISILGSIIFANIMYMNVKDSFILTAFLNDKNIVEKFNSNFISIVKEGVMKR
ncbi:MAG TPA: TetR/AcrR family transcriptional regulator [Spirochaetota bacterium]|nr:TetR/AcrR family transcriptional regulator [Spirochaetota bacterium]